MALCKTFLINGHNYAPYVNRYGLNIDYVPITIQQEKYTMDGTLHSKDLTNKARYRIQMNPVTEEVANAILADYRAAAVTLTIFDPNASSNRIISCKTAQVNIVPALVQNAEITYWQLGELVFTEK